MDGMHDLGGKQGFSALTVPKPKKQFNYDWEARTFALNGMLVGKGVYNMDEYRHAIERMDPRLYLTAAYYERVLTGIVSLCLEKGLVTAEEMRAALGDMPHVAQPSAAGRLPRSGLPPLSVGQRVRVRNDFVPGHIRMPAYIRGKCGVIVGVTVPYPFPDASAHGLGEFFEPSYDVRFQSSELWGEGCDASEVHVGVFRNYLDIDENDDA